MVRSVSVLLLTWRSLWMSGSLFTFLRLFALLRLASKQTTSAPTCKREIQAGKVAFWGPWRYAYLTQEEPKEVFLFEVIRVCSCELVFHAPLSILTLDAFIPISPLSNKQLPTGSSHSQPRGPATTRDHSTSLARNPFASTATQRRSDAIGVGGTAAL